MPFRDHRTGEKYLDFEECKRRNQDKRSPGGYCATAKRITEEQPDLINEDSGTKKEIEEFIFGR